MSRSRLSMSLDSYRAVLDGRKTVTRRVIVPPVPPEAMAPMPPNEQSGEWVFAGVDGDVFRRAPYAAGGVVGLTCAHWRATWGGPKAPYPIVVDDVTRHMRSQRGDSYQDACKAAELRVVGWRRMPAHLMPRWACVHEVKIVSVRAERLQDITIEECDLEGAASLEDFKALWDSLNAKRGHPWEANDWVWRDEFKLGEAEDV